MDTNQENSQPDQQIDQAHQQPVPTEMPPHKSRRMLIVAGIIATVAAISAVAFALSRKETATNQPKTEDTTDVATDSAKPSNSQAAAVKLPGIKGLSFDVPEGWYVKREVYQASESSTGTSIQLISPDSILGSGDPFTPLKKGYLIRMGDLEPIQRDITIEDGYANPLDAYAADVGAPRINDGSEYFDQPIDTSKIVHFENKSSLKFVAYPWLYEGCMLSVKTLSEDYVYTFSFHIDDTCPQTEILQTDQNIKSFIDTIRFSNTETFIETTRHITYSTVSKDYSTTSIYYDGVSYEFTKQYPTSYDNPSYFDIGVFGSNTAAFAVKDNVVQSLLLDADFETMKKTYEGGGILQSSHSSSIIFKPKEKESTSGYTKISDELYGKMSDAPTFQTKAIAKKYEYVKITDAGSFIVTFTLELAITDTSDLTLPAVDAPYIIENFKFLQQSQL